MFIPVEQCLSKKNAFYFNRVFTALMEQLSVLIYCFSETILDNIHGLCME